MSDDQHEHGPPSVGAGTVKRIVNALYALCAIVVLLEFTYEAHPHYEWEITGFHAIYGFISYVGLVLLAKQWRKVVMRDEDYYDRD